MSSSAHLVLVVRGGTYGLVRPCCDLPHIKVKSEVNLPLFTGIILVDLDHPLLLLLEFLLEYGKK